MRSTSWWSARGIAPGTIAVHRDMNATADLCHSETLSEVGAVAAHHTNKGWVFRPFLEPPAVRRRPMPLTLFQTYMHDDHPGPPAMCREFLADFDGTFCNDEVLLQTLSLHAGDSGEHLIRSLRQPAHKADVFRYVYHYHYGGVYLDIKTAMRIPFTSLLDCMAKEWDLTQVRRSTELGHCQKGVTGALPREYKILAIGAKNDHIFQGIIYGQPRHPLMLRAINHAFILSKVANLE